MKKSLISLLSIMTAIGSLSPTVAVPSAHAETFVQTYGDNDIDGAIQDLLATVTTARQTIRQMSRVPGANQRLNGKLENLENSVRHIQNLSDRRSGDRELSRAIDDLKQTFLDAAIEFGLSTVALIPTVQRDWYEVPMAIGSLEQAVDGSYRDPRQPDPRYPDPRQPDPRDPRGPGRMSFEFRGSVKKNPVYFTGNTAADLKASCMSYVQSSRISSVYDMGDESGKSIASTSSSMDANQICSVALLNSKMPGYDSYGYTEMTIKGVHVAINNALTDDQVADLVATSGFGFTSVYDVSVRGQNFSMSSSLSVSGQKAVIRYNIPRTAPIMKVGSIKNIPFSFSGYTGAEIQNQCLDFWAQTTPSSVYDITVNGRTYSSSSSRNAQNACMTIMAAQ